MANIRNAVISKDLNETKMPDSCPKESNATVSKDPNIQDATFPARTVAAPMYNTPLVIAKRNPQKVIKGISDSILIVLQKIIVFLLIFVFCNSFLYLNLEFTA